MSQSSNLWGNLAALAACGIATAILSVRRKDRPTSTSRHKEQVFKDTNNPLDGEGRVHHLHVRKGEVANRVLSVGDVGRAERIASLLESGTHVIHGSSRGFVTHTGKFNGVDVSIIATGMGYPMMDFVVRETRAVTDGPMVRIRKNGFNPLQDRF